ncbi:MAG: prepilin-type N-terminal cleavage/methylation domain-containing protein, partial [candidate division WOR-3 bacterium]
MSKLIKRSQKGFTLVEIMIVVLIIGILLAIAVPNFIRARESSRAKSCVANLKQIESAKEQWAMDTKAAPTATPAAKPAEPTKPAAAASPTAAPAAKPSGGAQTTIALVGWNYEPPLVQQNLDRFMEQYPQYKVNYEPIAGEYLTALIPKFQAKSQVD